jgi:energy-coupling factor transport system ATP-binding protein
VVSAIEFVGLSPDILPRCPFDLSGGQKRRVAIAGVIAMNPDVLVLDEPTAGLDPAGRDEILERIREYHEKKGGSVLLVSHSMEDVARIASRICVMNQGRLVMSGAPSEIFGRSDELEAMGLSVPQITAVFRKLRDRGLDVSPNVYTVDQARDEILKRIRKPEE